MLLLLSSPIHAAAQTEPANPRATTFPAEGNQILATKGDVTYWFEQARDYGTKTIGPAHHTSSPNRPQYRLTLSNGTLVCTLAGLAPTGDPAKTSYTDQLNDCAFTYSDTGHVRVLTPNLVNGAIDRLFDGSGPDAKVITTADGGFNGEKDGDGKTAVEPGSGNECGINALCWLGRLPGILASGIAYLLLILSSMILWVAGTVYNWVVIRTVFQFSLYFGTSEGMLVAWGVLRDIANIALLFGFIFMGIATILNTPNMEGYSAKRALPRLIIFAVLLNFSLFATQGIIDVANGFAAVFNSYAGEQTCDTATSNGGGQSAESCASVGISGKIMAAAGMNHIPSLGDAADGITSALDRPYTTATMLIILSVLVTITAVVLFAAAIMLVIRVVVLSLLMVTSPIGFAGMAIPSLQGIAKDWWHQLINQSFFAPLYLLMVFISLKLVDGLQSGGATIPDAIIGNTQSTGSTVAGNMQVLVVYAVVIGFMIASLIIAKKMGAAGAGFATSTAAGIAFGAQGFVARRTVGRASAMLGQRVMKTKWAEKNPGMARLAYGGLNKVSTASLSTRNLAGSALKTAGVSLDLGKANKVAGHGYHGIEEKAEKERLEFAKNLDDRIETKEENQARVVKLQADHEKNAADIAKSETAVADARERKAETESALVLAKDKKARAEEHFAARKYALDEQRLVVAKNPGNTAALDALREEELNFERATAELQSADAELTEVNGRLAAANNNLAEAMKALSSAEKERERLSKISTGRITVTGKERQKNYANAMHDEDTQGISSIINIVTAGGHGNHVAAAKILKDANKSETDKALDTLKKAMKEAEKAKDKDDHGDNHGAGASHGDSGHKGGGGHSDAGHGGGHAPAAH